MHSSNVVAKLQNKLREEKEKKIALKGEVIFFPRHHPYAS
jgi:hypothetical protein